MAQGALTPNAVLVRRALLVTAIAVVALTVLAFLSRLEGGKFVLALESANAAARAQRDDQLGHYQAAAAEYYRQLELQPDDADIRAALVELQLRRGLDEEAARQAQLLIDQTDSPDRPRDLALYGNVLMATGDKDAAAEAYSEAIEMRPAYPDGLYGLGLLAATDGRLKEAEQYFELVKSAGMAAASPEYARNVRNAPELERRFRGEPNTPRLDPGEAVTLIVWYLKQGRLEEATSVYRKYPAVKSLSRLEPAVATVGRLADGTAP